MRYYDIALPNSHSTYRNWPKSQGNSTPWDALMNNVERLTDPISVRSAEDLHDEESLFNSLRVDCDRESKIVGN